MFSQPVNTCSVLKGKHYMNFLNLINIGNNRDVFGTLSNICENAPSCMFYKVLGTLLNKNRIRMPLEVVLLSSLSTISTFCVNFPIYRSSHRSCPIKNFVLKNFAKFTGKYAGVSFSACNFIKKETLAQVFSCEFWERFKNPFFTEYLRVTAFRTV